MAHDSSPPGPLLGGEDGQIGAVVDYGDAFGFGAVVADDFVADEMGDGNDVMGPTWSELDFLQVEKV